MDQLQKKYHAFIESECTRLGFKDVIKPLQEGFAAMCEADYDGPDDMFDGRPPFGDHDIDMAPIDSSHRCRLCGRYVEPGDVPLDETGLCDRCRENRDIYGDFGGDSGDDLR